MLRSPWPTARTVYGGPQRLLPTPDLDPTRSMFTWMLASFIIIAAAAFAVRRTSHQAEQPRKWVRNGLLGIGTITTAVMALLIGLRNANAFAILVVWLPAMIAGILVERWQHGRVRPD